MNIRPTAPADATQVVNQERSSSVQSAIQVFANIFLIYRKEEHACSSGRQHCYKQVAMGTLAINTATGKAHIITAACIFEGLPQSAAFCLVEQLGIGVNVPKIPRAFFCCPDPTISFAEEIGMAFLNLGKREGNSIRFTHTTSVPLNQTIHLH